MKITFDTEHASDALISAIIDELTKGRSTQDKQVETKKETVGETRSNEPSIFDKPKTETKATSDKVDQHGVIFNPEYCGVAQVPFYTSGPKKGQWKKRQGVDEDSYDDWYADQLPNDADDEELIDETDEGEADNAPSKVDSAAAFSGKTQPVQEDSPQEVGHFFRWLADRQTDGSLDQNKISQAYQMVGIQVKDLLPPTNPETIKTNFTSVYNILSSMLRK